MKTIISKTLMAFLTAIVVSFVSACGGDEPDQPTPTPPAPTTVAVTGVSLNKTSLALVEGGSETLSATVAPSNASNKNVSWTSSASSVATVDGSGKVTAVAAGTATITVTTADGGKTATCAVTVTAKKIAVTGVTLDKETLEIVEGEEATLTATVAPENATDKSVTWATSDETIVMVDAGKVMAVKPGTATVTVKTTDGEKTATCAVTVVEKVYPVESVTLDKETLELVEGDTAALTATVAPENATDKTVTWKSSDEAVATVAEDGTVTAVAPGTATLTVTTTDGEKTATCAVTVAAKVYPVESVSVDKETLEIVEGDTAALTATVAPENATDKTVTWKSSDEAVATVAEDGTVTAVAPGTATITVTTTDGEKTATCAVTVAAKVYPVESVSVDKETLELVEGDEAALTATVAPENATDKTIAWKSSDETVATVDANGKVVAVAPGDATITVTTTDGGKTATCEVSVTAKIYPVESVSLDKETAELVEGEEATLVATIAPENATFKAVSWTSSDEAVAKVDENGKVTAVAPGKATITVTTTDGDKTATCAVTVTPKPILVKAIEINRTELTLVIGKLADLVATVTPADATNKNVVWSSSDEAVATVTQTGRVEAIAPGTATITATAADGSGISASCEVTSESLTPGTPVSKIEIKDPDGKVGFHWQYITATDYTCQLTAVVSPDNATNKAVKWKSSDTDALTVDSNGKVTFKKESFDAYVTATAADKSGVTAKMFFSINEARAEKINLTSSGGTSYFQTRPNGAFKVTAKLTRTSDGRSVFNNKVTWSLSSNASSYAKIESSTDLTCTIRGLKEIPKGQTVILTATAKDASGKVVCEEKQPIYVSGKPYISKISITTGGSTTVGSGWPTTATVLPETADVKKVEWVTSDKTVVELTYPDPTDKRKVRFNGKKKGKATIYCRATDGSGVISNSFVMYVN